MNAEFERYYNELAKAYDSGELYFNRNFDRLHNAAIMLLMLEKGKRISMFCGSMSVFKNDFYMKIDNGNPDMEIRDRIRDAFVRFVNTDGKHIDIIIEKYSDSITDGLIFDRKLLENKSVSVYGVPDVILNRDDIGHFSYIDNSEITRLETDAEEHRAICKIGPNDGLESPVNAFNKLKDISYQVNFAER